MGIQWQLPFEHVKHNYIGMWLERERERWLSCPSWKVYSCTPPRTSSLQPYGNLLYSNWNRERERDGFPCPFLEGIQLYPHESLLYHHMAICFTAIGTGAKFNSNNFFSYKLTITLSSSLHSTQEPQTDNPSNQPISVASHRLSISVGSKTTYTSSVSLLTWTSSW